MKAKFIINPISGGKKNINKEIQLIKEIFSARNAVADFHITSYSGEANDIAKKSIYQGYDIIVSVGGDGTLNESKKSGENTSLKRSTPLMLIVPMVSP